jgi:hypothetical protein
MNKVMLAHMGYDKVNLKSVSSAVSVMRLTECRSDVAYSQCQR